MQSPAAAARAPPRVPRFSAAPAAPLLRRTLRYVAEDRERARARGDGAARARATLAVALRAPQLDVRDGGRTEGRALVRALLVARRHGRAVVLARRDIGGAAFAVLGWDNARRGGREVRVRFGLDGVEGLDVEWEVEVVLQLWRAGDWGGPVAYVASALVRSGGVWKMGGVDVVEVVAKDEEYACGFAVEDFVGMEEVVERVLAREEREARELAISASKENVSVPWAPAPEVVDVGRLRGVLRSHGNVAGDVPTDKQAQAKATPASDAALSKTVSDSDDTSGDARGKVSRNGERASGSRRLRVPARPVFSMSVSLEAEGRNDARLTGSAGGSVFANALEKHVYLGLDATRPDVAAVRADCRCPLCALDCARPWTLASHILYDHPEMEHCITLPAVRWPPGAPPRVWRTRVYRFWPCAPRRAAEIEALARRPPGWRTQLLHVSRERSPRVAKMLVDTAVERVLRAAIADMSICDGAGECGKHDCRCRYRAGEPVVPVEDVRERDCDTESCVSLSLEERESYVYTRQEARGGMRLLPPLDCKWEPKRSKETMDVLLRAVRERHLYHLKSLATVMPEHVGDDDNDSEDDVDEDWRLQCSIDDLWKHSGLTPRQRVLGILWNQFAHEKYAAAEWGERYTRHSLEMFALMHRREIVAPRGERSLRFEFFAFLRALHVHGCMDATGMLSVMLCLDGAKQYQDCASSAKPIGKDCKPAAAEETNAAAAAGGAGDAARGGQKRKRGGGRRRGRRAKKAPRV